LLSLYLIDVLHNLHTDGYNAMCQVRRAFPVDLEALVQPDHLDFRAYLATQAILDFLVDLEIQGVGVFRAVRDLRDFSVPLAQQVRVFLYCHLLTALVA